MQKQHAYVFIPNCRPYVQSHSDPYVQSHSDPYIQSHSGTYLQGPGQTNFTRVPLGKNTLEPASTVTIFSVGAPGATPSRVTWSSIFPSTTITCLVDQNRISLTQRMNPFQTSRITLDIVALQCITTTFTQSLIPNSNPYPYPYPYHYRSGVQ